MTALPIYAPGATVQVSVDVPTSGGGPITPATTSAVLLDELGSTVQDFGAITLAAGATQVSETVPAASNALPAGKVMGLRRFVVTFTTSDGSSYQAETSYVLQAATMLVPMTNTFATYEEALLLRFQRAALPGWDGADKPSQVAALMTAYDRLCRLQYQFANPNLVGPWDQANPGGQEGQGTVPWQGYLYHHLPQYKRVIIRRIRQATPADFALWPQQLQDALKLAQLIEADDILGGNPVENKRRMGIISEEAAEAKMTFQAKPLRTHACREALNVLTPFLYYQTLLQRT